MSIFSFPVIDLFMNIFEGVKLILWKYNFKDTPYGLQRQNTQNEYETVNYLRQ